MRSGRQAAKQLLNGPAGEIVLSCTLNTVFLQLSGDLKVFNFSAALFLLWPPCIFDRSSQVKSIFLYTAQYHKLQFASRGFTTDEGSRDPPGRTDMQ